MEIKDRLSEIRDTEELKSKIHEFIDTLTAEKANQLVFFIDELDRCKPDYAIRFLERIKHYFNDERITFVFSVSLTQLQWTNRAAQTEEEKDEVRRQMNILKSIDPKAFAVAVGYMAKNTEQKVKELTMAEKLGEITDMVSMAYIAKAYFGKSRSWLAQKMNGNIVNGKTSQFSPDELAILRTALQDMSKKFGALSLTI